MLIEQGTETHFQFNLPYPVQSVLADSLVYVLPNFTILSHNLRRQLTNILGDSCVTTSKMH